MIINPIVFGNGGSGDLKPYAERSGSMVLKDNKISYVASSAFGGAYGWASVLTEVSLMNCSIFYDMAFCECGNLSKVYAPNCVEYEYAHNPSYPSVLTSCQYVFQSCNNLIDTTLGFSVIPSGFFIRYFGNYYAPSMGSYYWSLGCTLRLPNCTSIGNNAFANAPFTSVYAPNCTDIASLAFMGADIIEAHFSLCTSINERSFSHASVNDVYLPLISSIPSYCFNGCGLLGMTTESYTGSFITSNITFIGDYAFSGCMNLSVFDFNSCSVIGQGAFNGTALSSVYAPLIDGIGVGVFGNCVDLISVDLPNASYIGADCFRSCVVLGVNDGFFSGSLSFPKVQEVSTYAFANCNNLSSISFPMLSSIYSGAFNNCYNLISLYLMGSSVCKLANSSCFVSTPIAGYSTSAGRYGSIYVPASLLSSYKAASHWSRFSSRFVGV